MLKHAYQAEFTALKYFDLKSNILNFLFFFFWGGELLFLHSKIHVENVSVSDVHKTIFNFFSSNSIKRLLKLVWQISDTKNSRQMNITLTSR